MKAVADDENAILFIDEIHTVIGAGATSGGAMDASNLLKPALQDGSLRCIGSTTYKEYRGHFEKDRALVRRFQKIDVPEPSVADTIKILNGLKSHYEAHHQVRFTGAALKTAVDLAARYLNDRKLPDKAIDVIDEAAAAQKLLPPSRRRVTIGQKDIETTIATMARIPSKHVSRDDKAVLASLEEDLGRLVFGQDVAIAALASAIKLSRAGLREPEKPVGNYLFSGPTGVGKTEVARQLAEALGIKLVRFDMSEYMERHTVSRLIGAPPGHVGNMQQAVNPTQVNKGAVIGDVLDDTLDNLAFFEALNELRALLGTGFFKDHPARYNYVAAPLVHFQDLEGLWGVHQRRDVAHRPAVHLAAGQARHRAVEVDQVQPGEAGSGEVPGLGRRIRVIEGRVPHLAAQQAHGGTVLQVDGGKNDHACSPRALTEPSPTPVAECRKRMTAVLPSPEAILYLSI